MELNEAQKKLVEEHANIAYFMANKYYKTNYSLVSNKNLELEDLSQIALEELCIRAKNIILKNQNLVRIFIIFYISP